MPGTFCSVAACNSNFVKAKKNEDPIRFFTFPVNPAVRKEWVRLCYRKDKFNPVNKRICSKHFDESQFDDIIHAKLTNTQPRKLKATAIPTLFLPNKMDKSPSERSKRLKIKERKEIVSKLLLLEKKVSDVSAPFVNTDDLPSTSKQLPYEVLLQNYNNLQKENEDLRIQTSNDKNEIETLRENVKHLQEQLKNADKSSETRIRGTLLDCLTPNQVDIMLKKKSKARWTTDEICKAYTLRYFSKRAYIYMKETLKYPLPGISTLQNWASNLEIQHEEETDSEIDYPIVVMDDI